MVKLAYTGLSHYRQISKADLTAAGVDKDTEGLAAINVVMQHIDPALNPDNIENTVEVPQAVADLLLERESTEWKVVKETASEPAPASTTTTSASGSSRRSSSTPVETPAT